MRAPNLLRGLEAPVVLMMFVLVLGFVVGITLDRVAAERFGSLDEAADFRLINEAWKIIQDVYVDRAAVQPQAMSHGAISGMVDALGDTGHSRFLNPEMVKALRNLQAAQRPPKFHASVPVSYQGNRRPDSEQVLSALCKGYEPSISPNVARA